jgi:hypothetical protein
MISSASPIVAALQHRSGATPNAGAISRVDDSPVVIPAPRDAAHRVINANAPVAPGLQSEDQIETPVFSKSGKRRRQQVSPMSQRYTVMKWIIEEANCSGDRNIASKAVAEFPELFRGLQKANIQKASRWWRTRDSFIQSLNSGEGTQRQSVSSNQTGASQKVVRVKSCTGRRCKRAPWVEWLHLQLLE